MSDTQVAQINLQLGPVSGQMAHIEFDQVAARADPNVILNKDLFNQIGLHCSGLEEAYGSLRNIIEELREKQIYLLDEPSLQVAKSYIWETHQKANPAAIDKYLGNLCQLLRCPPDKVPEHPCITGTLPHWQSVGDEVDCLLTVARDLHNQRDLDLEWWYGVVIKDTSPKTVEVFWVGTPPKDGSRRQVTSAKCNPSIVRRKHLRSHKDDAYHGCDSVYSVAYIRQTYIYQQHGADPFVSDDHGQKAAVKEADGANGGSSGGSAAPKGPNPTHKPKPPGKSRNKLGKGKCKGGGEGKKQPGSGSAGRPGRGSSPEEQTKQIIMEPSVFDWLAPFLQSDRIESDLALLQSRPDLHGDLSFFSHYLQLLERLRIGQGVMYSAAAKFKQYFERQAEALSNYQVIGVVQFDQEKKDSFIESMNSTLKAKYVEAFTRNELVVICCLLAHPGLTYTNIDQKTRVAQKSGMVRGMSFVPEAVEKFFHSRLRKLKLIDDVNHPRHMEPLSTVVINSTYCHNQIVSYGYGSEFQTMDTEECPLIFKGFPEFLSINGAYVRVKDEAAGGDERKLYAQVMSKKAAKSFNIPEGLVNPHKDFARVLDVRWEEGQKTAVVKVQCFLSKGLGEPDDPICIATFDLETGGNSESHADLQLRVIKPRMFSHIGPEGRAVYQDMDVADWSPRGMIQDCVVASNCDLEYGPNFVPRRVNLNVGSAFKPAGLTEQAAHCDGNFYQARGQWAEVSPERPSGPGHGLYRLSSHVPLRTDSDMENADLIEPVFLRGRPHQNSMSFLMNVNGKTTLTFPSEDATRRIPNHVDDVPFGGLSAFSFIQEHLGSLYGLDPNERPHLYAHSGDLRQFPSAGFSNLLLILAAKQRVENLRSLNQNDQPDVFRRRLMEVETALKHFIFDMLTTTTYKASSQAQILQQVRARAIQDPPSSQSSSQSHPAAESAVATPSKLAAGAQLPETGTFSSTRSKRGRND